MGEDFLVHSARDHVIMQALMPFQLLYAGFTHAWEQPSHTLLRDAEDRVM